MLKADDFHICVFQLWHFLICHEPVWFLLQKLNILISDARSTFEPAHEIMALFVLRKFILHTCIPSHPVVLAVWCLVGSFIYFRTSFVRTAKALARLHRCADLPEPLLVAYVISTIISWAGSFPIWSYAFWQNYSHIDCTQRKQI